MTPPPIDFFSHLLYYVQNVVTMSLILVRLEL